MGAVKYHRQSRGLTSMKENCNVLRFKNAEFEGGE